jgi:hypothetical protein
VSSSPVGLADDKAPIASADLGRPHSLRWPPKGTLSQEDLEQWTNMWETAEGLNRLPPDSDS